MFFTYFVLCVKQIGVTIMSNNNCFPLSYYAYGCFTERSSSPSILSLVRCLSQPSIVFQIPYLCSDVGIGTDLGEITVTKAKFDCSVVVGYQAVYRVCFGLSAFFFLFSMLMIKVGSSRDPRSKIQNG